MLLYIRKLNKKYCPGNIQSIKSLPLFLLLLFWIYNLRVISYLLLLLLLLKLLYLSHITNISLAEKIATESPLRIFPWLRLPDIAWAISSQGNIHTNAHRVAPFNFHTMKVACMYHITVMLCLQVGDIWKFLFFFDTIQ